MSYTLHSATELFDPAAANSAAALAQSFESRLARQGWRAGTVFGPENQLAEEFETSPYLVRQALRILEGRGLGKMRRGSPGGLVLQVPTNRATAQAMSLYLSAQGVTPQQVAAARCGSRCYWPSNVSPQEDRLTDAMISELGACFDEREQESGVSFDAPNRASAIARCIVGDAKAGRDLTRSLVTMQYLCDRYGACRPVVVQAVRILEDLELVSSVRGRSGGLRLRPPSHSMIARVTYGHFAARQICAVSASEIIWAVNCASAARVADQARHDPAILKHLREQVVAEDFMHGAPWSQIALWRHLADWAGDPILHMMARCFFAYKLRAGMIEFARFNLPRARRLADATHAVAEAVMMGRADLASQAVSACRMFLGD